MVLLDRPLDGFTQRLLHVRRDLTADDAFFGRRQEISVQEKGVRIHGTERELYHGGVGQHLMHQIRRVVNGVGRVGVRAFNHGIYLLPITGPRFLLRRKRIARLVRPPAADLLLRQVDSPGLELDGERVRPAAVSGGLDVVAPKAGKADKAVLVVQLRLRRQLPLGNAILRLVPERANFLRGFDPRLHVFPFPLIELTLALLVKPLQVLQIAVDEDILRQSALAQDRLEVAAF